MINKSYIAGFFDADGCLSIIRSYPYERNREASVRYSPVINFTNTNRKVLEEIQKFLGCGKVYTHKSVKPNWKKRNVIQIGGCKAVFRVLEEIVDFLIIKKSLAEKVLQYRVYFSDGRSYKHGNQYTGVKSLPENVLQKREELFNWCKNFNKKGI